MKRNGIAEIIATTTAIERFWSSAHGWASKEVTNLLDAARLDRQTSFAHTLVDYLEPFSQAEMEARQILGYATLRSLCEGTLKLFFCVYYHDTQSAAPFRDKKGKLISAEEIAFDKLIKAYVDKADVYHKSFLERVQRRGNAIHHFKDRDIGTQDELIDDIGIYLDFLLTVKAYLPSPNES